jgi:hypothetical protein
VNDVASSKCSLLYSMLESISALHMYSNQLVTYVSEQARILFSYDVDKATLLQVIFSTRSLDRADVSSMSSRVGSLQLASKQK